MSSSIKVWEYLETYQEEKTETLQAIERVFESGWLILGEEVKNFENEFAAYCGVKHGIGVNSATDAIFLGLKALGIGPGDEVITVSNTAVPTVSAIESTGARTRFVDVEESTALMNPKLIEEVITNATKCILPVHLFGQCVDMKPIQEIAQKRGLKIFEDCAQSHGATYKGFHSGSFGNASASSFYPTKILGGYGDGGMVLTNEEKVCEKMRRLRFYGMKGTYYAEEHGYNSRLDELHAAILRVKLKKLNHYVQRRREIAGWYRENLDKSDFILPLEKSYGNHAYYLFVVRHPKRDEIIQKLKEKDIFLNISYPWPVHIMNGYQHLEYKEGDFPVTERLSKEIFSLPMFPSLTRDRVDRVCEELKKF